jgi:hypothetical protein
MVELTQIFAKPLSDSELLYLSTSPSKAILPGYYNRKGFTAMKFPSPIFSEHRSLYSLLPPGNIITNGVVSDTEKVMSTITLAIFLWTNNLIYAESERSLELFGWLRRNAGMSLFRHLSSLDETIFRSIGEKLFICAMLKEDVHAVRYFAKEGISEKAFRQTGRDSLVHACYAENTELVQTLTEYYSEHFLEEIYEIPGRSNFLVALVM